LATTLDTVLKTNTTLSGGNLVATSTGLGGVRSGRALSGLTYFEGVITTLTGSPQIGVAAPLWGTSTNLGAGSSGCGYQASGIVTIAGATVATLAAFVAGNSIGVAVDPKNRLIWFRVGAGNWNNNVVNDPVTQVGGIDISSLPGTLTAAISASLTGNVWTMTFSTPFANTAPTGYASIDTIAYLPTSTANRSPLPIVTSLPASYDLTVAREQTTKGKHFSPAGAITVVSGTTKEVGVAVASKKVEVYDRNTGDLLGVTLSDGSGNWSIPCLGRPAVRVVGSDPTTYNSVVYDNVVPV
jgi:hypothetical protein